MLEKVNNGEGKGMLSVCCNNDKIEENRHVEELSSFYSAIKKGQIFIQHDFLNPSEVSLLRKDIMQLMDLSSSMNNKSGGGGSGSGCYYFKPSGLSNRVPGDENKFGVSDRLTCTITPDLIKGNLKYANMRCIVEQKMEMIRSQLELALSSFPNSITNNDHMLELKSEEMYYSISPTGSHLPRHSDERHEETKGSKGWINETRRSISWLLYLNYDNSTNKCNDHRLSKYSKGGQLRAYCRISRGSDDNSYIPCGSHQGNLQVGWLRQPNCETKKEPSDVVPPKTINNHTNYTIEFEPVFLDSWIQTPMIHDGKEDHDLTLKWAPMSALYRVNNTKTTNGNNNFKDTTVSTEQSAMNRRSFDRDYLSKPFGSQSASWPSDTNLEPKDFAKALSSQLSSSDHQKRFIGVEDIHLMNDPSMIDIVDIVPTGGTLVMFDSVTVPHEVLEVQSGERLAIAGWFHEIQQQFPDWYGT